MEELKVDYPSILLYCIKQKWGTKSNIPVKDIVDYLELIRLDSYGEVLTPLQVTTATMAYNSDIKMDYKIMAKYIKKNDTDILAVKSPDIPYEECIKNKYTRADIITKRRGRIIARHNNIMAKQYRRTVGNGLYFNSSFEIVIGSTEKKYNVRISPSKGSIQIQGLDSPIYYNSKKYINRVLEHIQESLELDQKHQVYNQRLIIINFKTEVISTEDNQFIKLMVLSNNIRQLMDRKGDGRLKNILPYDIVYNTESEEIGSYIRLKFATPLSNNQDRKTTVKIFSGRKINILGAAHSVPAMRIYKFLDLLFQIYYDSLIIRRVVNKKYTYKEGDWINLF